MMTSYVADPTFIRSWLKASLRDDVTRDWIHKTGLQEYPTLGPTHLGQGAWIALKGQESSRVALEAQESANAWLLKESSILSESEELVRNRREWSELFFRFTVHARWAGPRGNKKLAQCPADVSLAPLDLMRTLNVELVLDAKLFWQKPISMSTIPSRGFNLATGGVYLWAAKVESHWIPLYAGIAENFSERFETYTRDYRNSVSTERSDMVFFAQIGKDYTTAKPSKLRNAFVWAKHHNVDSDNLVVLVAELPKPWCISKPFPACYFRDGSSPKGQMQMIWAVDNILSSSITGQKTPLNTESSKNRRLVLGMEGHWPDEWPKVVCSYPPPSVTEKRRQAALDAPLLG